MRQKKRDAWETRGLPEKMCNYLAYLGHWQHEVRAECDKTNLKAPDVYGNEDELAVDGNI